MPVYVFGKDGRMLQSDGEPAPLRRVHPLHFAISKLDEAALSIADMTGTGTERINERAVAMFALVRAAHVEASKVIAEHAEMRAMLSELELACSVSGYCPVCKGDRYHETTCRLAALLAKVPTPETP